MTAAKSVTIEQVAEAAGVSRSTVSRVVNGSSAVSPAAKDAVDRAIADLRYVPNQAARTLASRQTRAIALVVPEDASRFFGDPFIASVVSGIHRRLSVSEYILNMVLVTHDENDRMVAYLRGGNVDGAIIVSHHTHDVFVERIAAAVPVVFGGRPAQKRDGASEYYVDVDNMEGARLATAHLIARGARDLATIAGPPDMPAGVDRLSGFHQALADAGLGPGVVEAGDFSEASGASAMRRILDRSSPDGVFIANDLMARGAMSVLEEHGLRIPDDVAIVGFDDSAVAVSVTPQLTTVRQPAFRQGELIAERLVELLAGENPERITIVDTELVVRGSA